MAEENMRKAFGLELVRVISEKFASSAPDKSREGGSTTFRERLSGKNPARVSGGSHLWPAGAAIKPPSTGQSAVTGLFSAADKRENGRPSAAVGNQALQRITSAQKSGLPHGTARPAADKEVVKSATKVPAMNHPAAAMRVGATHGVTIPISTLQEQRQRQAASFPGLQGGAAGMGPTVPAANPKPQSARPTPVKSPR